MINTNTFAFIFARGGSKGIKKKNLQLLDGHPLCAHSILIASQTPEITDIFLSTDCLEIADVGNQYGASIISRPSSLASDSSSEWSAWQHAVSYVQSEVSSFSTFVSLPPTAPCRSVSDVQKCIHSLNSDNDVVVSVSKANRHPSFNIVSASSSMDLSVFSPPTSSINRRQDASVLYDMTTVCYVSTPQFIIKSDSMWDGRVTGVLIPKHRALDIDDHVDLAVARFLFSNYS